MLTSMQAFVALVEEDQTAALTATYLAFYNNQK